MNNFWALAGFEFKKIFRRKTFPAAIIICLGIMAVAVFSSLSGGSFHHSVGNDISKYEAMELDKAVILTNRGYITPQLVYRAILSNREMISDEENYFVNEYGSHLKEEAYIRYILPYEPVIELLNKVYAENMDWLSMDALSLVYLGEDKAVDRLGPEQAESFDADLRDFARAMVFRDKGLSAVEREKNLELIDSIETPLYSDYYGGYEAYIMCSKSLAITVLFMILLLLSPLFSNEYEEKTDQVILCTKNGKGSLCRAKLFVALVVSLLSAVLVMGLSWLGFLMLYGFQGGRVNIQVVNPGCSYPFTLLEACCIHFISVAFASVLFGAFIAFMSARVKRSTAPVVVMGTLLTIIPMFIWIPLKSSGFMYELLKFFPVNSVTFDFDRSFIEIFGVLFTPYKFIWAVSAVLTAAFSSMAAVSFKGHQTG